MQVFRIEIDEVKLGSQRCYLSPQHPCRIRVNPKPQTSLAFRASPEHSSLYPFLCTYIYISIYLYIYIHVHVHVSMLIVGKGWQRQSPSMDPSPPCSRRHWHLHPCCRSPCSRGGGLSTCFGVSLRLEMPYERYPLDEGVRSC